MTLKNQRLNRFVLFFLAVNLLMTVIGLTIGQGIIVMILMGEALLDERQDIKHKRKQFPVLMRYGELLFSFRDYHHVTMIKSFI